jgi:WhiB family redox-sensing transcriptional regulator
LSWVVTPRAFAQVRGGDDVIGYKPGYIDGSVRDPADVVTEAGSSIYGNDPSDLVAEFSAGGASFLRALVAARPQWMSDAACRGSELDFTSRAKGVQSACIQVCGSCAVRVECLEWALETQDEVAVLGGMTGTTRRAHRRAAAARQRQTPKHTTPGAA